MGGFDIINVGFEMDYWQPVLIGYSHDFIRGVNNARDRSISTVKVAYRPTWSRWQVELRESYDFKGNAADDKNPRNLDTVIALSRDIHCWRLIFTAEFSKGRKGNASFGVQLQPSFLTGRTVEL